MPMELKQS